MKAGIETFASDVMFELWEQFFYRLEISRLAYLGFGRFKEGRTEKWSETTGKNTEFGKRKQLNTSMFQKKACEYCTEETISS